MGTRDPRLVALDLAAQAEHGPGSLVGAISPRRARWICSRDELERLASEHQQLRPAACVLVQSADAREALEIANVFAPEHLQLIGAEPEALAARARTAGCLFVGAAAATAFGDYVAGSNHILPTERRGALRVGPLAAALSPADGRSAPRRGRWGDGAQARGGGRADRAYGGL